MAQFTVRNLEDDVKEKLKRRAARRGISMEEEVRTILRDAVKQERARAGGLGSGIAARFTGLGLKAPLPEFKGEPPRPAELDS